MSAPLLPFALVCLCLAACGGADDADASTSSDPGGLGAPCETAADCDGDAVCTGELDANPGALSACAVPCGEGDACPPGSFCTRDWYMSDARGEISSTPLCVRACEDDDFCAALHPETNACRTWSSLPADEVPADAPRFCGIGG